MTPKTPKKTSEKATEKRIERAYYASCRGMQIDVMQIGSVFAEGRRLLAEGADDAALGEGLRAFVKGMVN